MFIIIMATSIDIDIDLSIYIVHIAHYDRQERVGKPEAGDLTGKASP